MYKQKLLIKYLDYKEVGCEFIIIIFIIFQKYLLTLPFFKNFCHDLTNTCFLTSSFILNFIYL